VPFVFPGREDAVTGKQLLWIDLRQADSNPCAVYCLCGNSKPCVDDCLIKRYEIEVIADSGKVEEAVRTHNPCLLCFDYDFPDQDGMDVLQMTMLRYPTLPVLILTRDYSVEFAIWALRVRVWDYFLKPAEPERLINSIETLLKLRNSGHNDERVMQFSRPAEMPGYRPFRQSPGRQCTELAASYVHRFLDKKITLDEVASHCGMSKSHFSRTFRSEYGLTFQEFIIQQRIAKAVELLKNTQLQVTQIAYAVGFSDLSNFSRMFQRHVGIHSSLYRKVINSPHPAVNTEALVADRLPQENPNPVLSCGADGVPTFVNPATSRLLMEMGLRGVEEILPQDHIALVTKFLGDGVPMTQASRVSGRTFVWQYRSSGDAYSLYIYGHDVSVYLSGLAGSDSFPKNNPNPVLSTGLDGTLQFVNPATLRLMAELNLENVEDILPDNHKGLVKASIMTGTPLSESRKIAERTIVWSYQPVENSDRLYIYGHDVSNYNS
jgi:AraC-like DNA-binding protein